MEWISLKERIPIVGQIVDLFGNGRRYNNYVFKDELDDIHGNYYFQSVSGRIYILRFNGDERFTQVTHWMPLPEPPKV